MTQLITWPLAYAHGVIMHVLPECMYSVESSWIILLSSYSDNTTVWDVITTFQKWHAVYPNNFVLEIHELNKANSTFAGTYVDNLYSHVYEYPLQGQYDPKGITIGWIVTTKILDDVTHEYYYTIQVWAGYLSCITIGLKSQWTLTTNRYMIDQEYKETTVLDEFRPE